MRVNVSLLPQKENFSNEEPSAAAASYSLLSTRLPDTEQKPANIQSSQQKLILRKYSGKMRNYSIIAAFAATLGLASANSVTFVSRDATDRTVCFTNAAGHEVIPNFVLHGRATAHVSFPHSWEGNWHTVLDGNCDNAAKIWGEVKFDGFVGLTYYDVDAEKNLTDNSGVHWLYPAKGNGVKSGCGTFPCDSAYKHFDDVQTRSTPEHDLICEIGG